MLVVRLFCLLAYVHFALLMPKTSDFLPLRRFYAHLSLFLFLLAYVLLMLFMLFMLARFFCEKHKTSPIPSFTILPQQSLASRKFGLNRVSLQEGFASRRFGFNRV